MKTTFKYDHYYLQKEIEDHVKKLAKKYPDLFDYEYLLTTADKHHIIATTLTNKKTGKADEKPAFYIDGNTHAGEVTGMMTAMHTMDYLVTNYAEDPSAKFILDNYVVYIVPCVSPDGSETYLTTPYILRSVNREYYEKSEGLNQFDIDNDGVLRMMRVKTPYGAWKISKDDPDVMIKRTPDDVCGDFYNIYNEGEIEGYDGFNIVMQKEKWGRDFNRNYPFGWFPEYRQPGAGEYPLCNPENKTMAEFIINHPNISSVATHHTSGGVLLTVPGTYPEKKANPMDMMLFKQMSEMGTQETGYKHINIFDTFTTDQENYASGAFDDYCYETQGIYAMTIEHWDMNTRAGVKNWWDEGFNPDTEIEDFVKQMNWVKENAPKDFKSWTKFKHPQLGNVEIGGFDVKFTMQNPPCSMLLQECEKMTKFMVRWAKAMPRLVIDSVEVKKLAGGYTQIDAVVSNAGYLPTYMSQKAKALGVAKPVVVSLTADKKIECINCQATQVIGDLSSYGLCPTNASFYGNIVTMNGEPVSKKVTWLVKGEPKSVTVTAQCPKGGKVCFKK